VSVSGSWTLDLDRGGGGGTTPWRLVAPLAAAAGSKPRLHIHTTRLPCLAAPRLASSGGSRVDFGGFAALSADQLRDQGGQEPKIYPAGHRMSPPKENIGIGFIWFIKLTLSGHKNLVFRVVFSAVFSSVLRVVFRVVFSAVISSVFCVVSRSLSFA
jgi:hypothetical protein